MTIKQPRGLGAERRVTGVTAIVRDIGEQKRSARRLAEERTRWVATFHSAPIGMADHLDGVWMAVNRALGKLLERDQDALLATDVRLPHALR